MPFKTIAGMASIKNRVHTLDLVLQSISHQVDVLYVYLNDHESVPNFFKKYKNVVPLLGSKCEGDLNANGKMEFLKKESMGIAFPLDDDLLYPNDYIKKMISVLSKYEFKACVGVHGSIIPDHASWYFERMKSFPMKNGYKYCNAVNLIGSGTAAFPITLIQNNSQDFGEKVFVDLKISLAAHKHNFPLLVIDRPNDWIEILPYEGLWEKFKANVTHHTHILIKETCWQSQSVRNNWITLFNQLQEKGIVNPAKHLNLSKATTGFIAGEPHYTNDYDLHWHKKLLQFSEFWA